MCFAVHGAYSEWMEWGACSVSCGTGVQRRLRQCNKPLPANGGRHCAGSASETRSCKGKPCPGRICVLLILNPQTYFKMLKSVFLSLQWMAIGQSGLPGRNALVPAVKVKGQESAPVVILTPNMVAEPAMAKPWRPSCAV